MSTTTTRSLQMNREIMLERELARGGEGTIYAVKDKPHLVAKIFHKPSPEKTAKLNAMLDNPPDDPTQASLSHISIAWPAQLIKDKNGDCVGFTMPYIDARVGFPLLKMYNPRDRRSLQCNFSWAYLLRMACNLASIIEALHDKGYVIGDLNESNILVTTEALVTLVDCDSIQVPKTSGQHPTYFLCTVGKPEYTPPELQGKDFSKEVRKSYHDSFALAVLIFLMLMEGRHPFSGSSKGNSEPRTIAQNIRERDFPYLAGSTQQLLKLALPFTILPKEIQKLMKTSFVVSASAVASRPTASDWVRALLAIESQLVCCRKSPLHVYRQQLSQCPWCQRIENGIPDPFPVTGATPPRQFLEAQKQNPSQWQLWLQQFSVLLHPVSQQPGSAHAPRPQRQTAPVRIPTPQSQAVPVYNSPTPPRTPVSFKRLLGRIGVGGILISVYWIEWYLSRFYGSWVTSFGLLGNVIASLFLVIMPVIICLLISRRYAL